MGRLVREDWTEAGPAMQRSLGDNPSANIRAAAVAAVAATRAVGRKVGVLTTNPAMWTARYVPACRPSGLM